MTDTHPNPWKVTDCLALPWLGNAEKKAVAHGTLSLSDGVEWLQLGPLFPGDPSKTRTEQAAEVWRSADRLLRENGFHFAHVARTWLYVDEILDWYGDFNQVRDEFFGASGIRRETLPASTAVGVDTDGRGAFALHLLAVRSPDGAPLSVVPVDSPLQGPAPDYGSGFSRAVEIVTRDRGILLVSGTASIDANGATRFPGELLPQIDETHRVLDALLKASGYSKAHVCRAMRYSTNSAALNGTLPAWLGTPVDAQVCRDDLVFEVELDAVKSSSPCTDDQPH